MFVCLAGLGMYVELRSMNVCPTLARMGEVARSCSIATFVSAWAALVVISIFLSRPYNTVK